MRRKFYTHNVSRASTREPSSGAGLDGAIQLSTSYQLRLASGSEEADDDGRAKTIPRSPSIFRLRGVSSRGRSPPTRRLIRRDLPARWLPLPKTSTSRRSRNLKKGDPAVMGRKKGGALSEPVIHNEDPRRRHYFFLRLQRN
ncbi:uncharacterized protein LOC105428347 isoform X2 [Pogonomyrmex barbatus]|uniref:Uncharacterized protein LOC105428347 isoform X2 n=1 Tax=Pogonomyrmex barbatus TaxID=144034 RepID=A0A6I9W9J9_9HYME|nr:uncharacterized protein LOC105428347 isoform X2 [Pogonomyrmex barbatus]